MEYIFSDKLNSLKPSAIREILKNSGNSIPFSAGNPSPLSFPVDAIRELSADILANSSTVALQYSITEGYAPLIASVAARLKSRFNIDTDNNPVIITSGGQQGIELACKAFCNEGDTVICENPSFIGALNAFRSLGANLVGIDIEGDGISPEALDRALTENPRAKLIYLIPTFQNPRGTTTSLEKRKAIYEVALRHKVMILEDNPYGELRFSGEEVPTMKSMDTEGIVIYCSSFSKILSAGMRVGFVSAPDAVIQKMVVAKQCEDVHTNIFFQMLCHRFMTEYDFDGHIKGICDLYGRKCALMMRELDAKMPASITHTVPDGGLFVWLTMPEGSDMMGYIKACTAAGVSAVPGIAFNADTEAPSDSFRITYATPSDEDIVKGIGIMADVANKFI
ncbi:MAG: PLP-dependent aminotransferase family protein [Clostridia bacterium]|nr:PLP-dependent aminotransferase family protein [Clostridia bacterium]